MQKPSPTSRSEYNSKINTQMNRGTTTPNAGTMPRVIPGSRTNNTMVPDTTNIRQNKGGSPMPPNTIRMPIDRSTPPTGTVPGTVPGTPINRGVSPRTGMPLNGTIPPATGMPMNGAIPPTNIPGTVPGTVPGMSNIYMPNITPYNTPMGVPLYPLYGYDNCEDLDRDMNYFKQLYPSSARRIQNEVNNECDKLEYDGSVMFDEYPDRVTLDDITDRVYDKVRDMNEASKLETKNLYFAPRGGQNILRDFINIILLNEIFNRRRRYRSRRRWF